MAKVDGNVESYPANAAVGDRLLVKLNSSGKVLVTGASDLPIGVTEREAFAADEVIPVRSLHGSAKIECIAAGTFAVGAELFLAAGGKVDDSGTVSIGVAGTAATTINDVVSVILTQ